MLKFNFKLFIIVLTHLLNTATLCVNESTGTNSVHFQGIFWSWENFGKPKIFVDVPQRVFCTALLSNYFGLPFAIFLVDLSSAFGSMRTKLSSPLEETTKK